MRANTMIMSAVTLCLAIPASAAEGMLSLDQASRQRCVAILEAALNGDEFWPAMHAAEALSIAGETQTVQRSLLPRLAKETDDQRRCGLARELVRSGQRRHAQVMFEILAGDDSHGHVHAAESLYKVFEVGSGVELLAAFSQADNAVLRLMAAAALARSGNQQAFVFLRDTLDEGDEQSARLAAWVLGRIGSSTDIPSIQQRVAAAKDPLAVAFMQHALAALGDAQGQAQLRQNLRSADAATRTYAAVFAGEARMLDAAPTLTALLDDAEVDVRVRAAQALLTMAQPAPTAPADTQILFAATPKNPRYTEGSMVELDNGDLLCAVTEFVDSGSDFARARIIAKRSTDRGRTWGAPRVLQETTGKLNVMSVTLRRLAPPRHSRIAMFYLQKNAFDDLRVYVRFSTDEAESFGEPILVTDAPGYHVLNNDRITQLRSGRLLVPVASTENVKTVNHFTSRCWYSDDGGQTWTRGAGAVDQPKRGAMEPETIELADGRVMMITRTQLGIIAIAFSDDGGDNWGEPRPLPGIQCPEAPSVIRRIPSTGDLLLIWNNTFVEGAGHGGRRTPLTAAISRDEGKTWQQIRNLETDKSHTYSYPSILFSRGAALLTYWDEHQGKYSTRYRRVPISWFYGS